MKGEHLRQRIIAAVTIILREHAFVLGRADNSSAKGSMMLSSLYAITLFLSAGLLFSLQPIIAKMLLPLFGGTPAVWTTCMVFFQGMLLAGYAYAHWISNRLSTRMQGATHFGLLVAAMLWLPFSIQDEPVGGLMEQTDPALLLLARLLRSVALPFFIVSASSPLLQKWFSNSRHASAKDPYFLYAASNLGSLITLLSYPVLIEPGMTLRTQGKVWMWGYALLATLIGACAWIQRSFRVAMKVRPTISKTSYDEIGQAKKMEQASGAGETVRLAEHSLPSDHAIATDDMGEGPSLVRSSSEAVTERLRWIALALVPSSLMLGVTTYLTTDIASIPLLWVLPLSIYLLSFVLVFAPSARFSVKFFLNALPIAAVGLIYLLLSEATEPVPLLIFLHLGFFFIAAMACHGRLAQERPPAARLTEFYFWISVGGVLGGLFNALVAPNIFSRVIEYPAMIVCACMVRPMCTSCGKVEKWQRIIDWLLPAGLGLVSLFLILEFSNFSSLPLQLRFVLIFGVPLMVAFTFVDRSLRFGLGLSAVLLASAGYPGGHGQTLHTERNFFGVLRVTLDPDGAFRRLVHGNTIHGRQFIDPARQCEPLSYYHRSGPLGQIFKIFEAKAASTNVAVVGLGAGSMASYAKPHQQWSYYEINPAVLKVAQCTNYFAFLQNTPARKLEVFLGDARLRLREASDAHFDLILLDAFSSDAIPMHLITGEAMKLYLSKLSDGGLLAFHISNRCLDLEPVLGNLAANSELVCYAQDEIEPSRWELADGKDQSHWVLMARRVKDLGRLVKDSRWLPVPAQPKQGIWTDDFSNIWSVFRWR